MRTLFTSLILLFCSPSYAVVDQEKYEAYKERREQRRVDAFQKKQQILIAKQQFIRSESKPCIYYNPRATVAQKQALLKYRNNLYK